VIIENELNWLELLPLANFGINSVEPAGSTLRELGERASSFSVSRLTLENMAQSMCTLGTNIIEFTFLE
jgi:hypothetical protein